MPDKQLSQALYFLAIPKRHPIGNVDGRSFVDLKCVEFVVLQYPLARFATSKPFSLTPICERGRVILIIQPNQLATMLL